MAVIETFSVGSKGLCVMCLGDGNGRLEEKSVRALAEYLSLDHRKIFNITAPQGGGGKGEETPETLVDVKVTVCKSCGDWGNKFDDLNREMEGLKKRMNSCVETMLEVMLNAESNLILSKRYRQRIAGGGGGEGEMSNGAKEEMEKVKKTIPERFRKETMHKCVLQVEKARKKDLLSGLNQDFKSEEPQFFEFHQNGKHIFPENLMTNGDYGSSSDEDGLRIDEDADAEELMIQYNSNPHGLVSAAASSSNSQINGFLAQSIWDDNSSSELATSSSSESKANFNSKYQCKICDKVVVSLKNFELHQRRHSGEKPFCCPFCDQTFRDTSNLRSHTLRYHRHYLFAKFQDSSLDSEQFKQALDKIVHSIVRVVEGAPSSHQSHQCFICSKEYTQKYAIEDHIVQRHYDVLSTALIQLQKDTEDYLPEDIAGYLVQVHNSGATCTMCGLCGQNFETGEEVNSHMKVHVRVKVARSSANLSPDEGQDSSLIQLKMNCNFCSKSFEDLTALKRHQMLHKGGKCAGGGGGNREPTYSCEHCGRTFCSYYSQRSHVLSFHRFEVFSQFLPKGVTAQQIEGVVKGITGRYVKLPTGLFQCSLCGKEITQLRKLQSHVLVTHFDKVVEKLTKALGKGGVPELKSFRGQIVDEEGIVYEMDESMDVGGDGAEIGLLGLDASARVEVVME